MTTKPKLPPVAPAGYGDSGATEDMAADKLSRLAAGNQYLVTRPHLITALYQANATPEQAQAINQFVGGLSAAGQVEAARQSGIKVALSNQDTGRLDMLGIHYNDVIYSASDLAADTQAQLTALEQPIKDQLAAEDAAKKNSGWFDGFGSFGSHLLHNPVTNTISGAYNFVGSGAAQVGQSVVQSYQSLAHMNSNASDPKPALTASNAARDAAARALGYDPTSPLSMLAFQASGKDTLDIEDLYANHGQSMVDDALRYADDPHKYLAAIVGDTALTPDQAATKLGTLKSDEFKGIVQQVLARRASPGDLVTLGIDPAKHPLEHTLIAAGTDIMFMFLTDPTIAALGVVKAAKISQLAIDTVGDSQKVYDVVIGSKRGLYASQVNRGVQSLLNNTKAISAGLEAGDDAAVASGWARIRTMTPGLEHMAEDFLGSSRAVGFKADGTLLYEKAAPITDTEQAAIYMSSRIGVLRLMSGRPTLEGRLMPGQLSAFGYRKIRGALASGAAGRSVKETDRVLNLNKPGLAGRILPVEGEDQVDAAGNIIEGSLHPQEVDPLMRSRARGDIGFASRTVVGSAGKPIAKGLVGMLAPGALLNRGRLVSQRFTSYLPRTTTFSTEAPDGAQQVFRYANMYLTRGDANLLAARWAAGDEGVRKSILQGMQMQTFHAAGLGNTPAGLKMIQKAEQVLTKERYSATEVDMITNPETGELEHVAVWRNQARPTITLARFQDIQKAAAKIGIWEATLGRVFQSTVSDTLMSIVKPGWLISGTNVVRNAGEDLFGAALRGEYGDVAKAKAVAAQNGLLPERTRLGSIVAAPLLRVAQGYRKLLLHADDPALGLKWIAEMDQDLAHLIADNWTHLHAGSMIDPASVGDLSNLAGYMPKQFSHRTGYGLVEVGEDQIGANRLANTLGQVVDGQIDHVLAVINHIEAPGEFPIARVVESLQQDMKGLTQMKRSGVYRDAAGKWRKAVTDEDKQLAVHQLAEDQVSELKYLLTSRDGELNTDLVSHIVQERKAPDSQWIMDNLAGPDRPFNVYAPTYEAVPVTRGVQGFVGAISDAAAKGYETFVERPIARLSSMPIFLSHYGKERQLLEVRGIADAMRESGLGDEAVQKGLQDLALQAAFNRTMKYIDDPTLRTQMDIVGRNFFAFSRATQAFIRRWGGQFIEDPARLRKAMITMEAAHRVGLTYTDQNGQKQFIFPGSGAAVGVIQHVESLLPGMDLVRMPVSGDFTGKVSYLNSGLQNPLQFSLTPIANIPLRQVENLFPQHREMFDEIDQFFNGQQGVGQGALSEIMPTTLKKFTDALNSDDRDSMLADSSRTAMLNLEAAGQTPPPGADAATVEKYLADLKTQQKNTLLIRAVLGYFSPSPPGQPADETSASKSDWFYGMAGAKGLKAEYTQMVNDAGGDYARANVIWASLHPDKLFYEIGSTTNQARSAVFSATQDSMNWINQNYDFMTRYKGVAAYFIPLDTQKGSFNTQAYHAELELGLRQHKSTAEFFSDIRTANANAQYFAATKERDAEIAADPKARALINKNFSDWKTGTFEPVNPGWASSQQDYTDAQNHARQQIDSLQNMLGAKSLPKSVPIPDVQEMLDLYSQYHQLMKQYAGSSNKDQSIHSQLAQQYNAQMNAIVTKNTQLGGLYQGVFRTIDPKILDPLGGS